jgi:hypothetical protein
LYKLAAVIQLSADLDEISGLVFPQIMPMFTSLMPEAVNFEAVAAVVCVNVVANAVDKKQHSNCCQQKNRNEKIETDVHDMPPTQSYRQSLD